MHTGNNVLMKINEKGAAVLKTILILNPNEIRRFKELVQMNVI